MDLNWSVGGGGGYRRVYGKWRHGMSGALVGHTLSFSRTSSPDCIHVGVNEALLHICTGLGIAGVHGFLYRSI